MSSLLYYALPALGSYALLSVFFLRWPRLLHTPWVPAFRLRLGAHRGGELVWGRREDIGYCGGIRRARHVPRWTAERVRSEGRNFRKRAGRGQRASGSARCGMRKKAACSTWAHGSCGRGEARGGGRGRPPGTHRAAPHRIWRKAGEHHGGHGEVSAPAQQAQLLRKVVSAVWHEAKGCHLLPSMGDWSTLEASHRLHILL